MKRIKKQFWLSEKENADFMKKVELSGLSQSAVLRILIKGYEPREKPDDRFYDLMRQFYAMSNNLNQIAIKANSLGFVDSGQWNMGRSSPIGLQERKWGVWSLSPHL